MSETLPEHWKTVRLEEIADVRGGASFPKAYQGNTEGKYPFYKVSDMNLRGNETLMQASNNWVEKDAVKTLRAKLFSKDTVIFPKVGAAVHTNKKRLLSCDGLVDNNVMGVTIRGYDRCIPYYLLYWFEFADLVDFSNPGPLPSITATKVKNTEIPLPPLSEQCAIAHVLQTIQEAKATRQRELALERERKAALMDFLFSHGTKGEPRKQTEIGEIPESWEVTRLGDLVKLKSGLSRPKDMENKPNSALTVPVYGGNGVLGYTSKEFSEQRLLVIGRVGEYCGCVHIAESPNWITDNALYSERWFNSEISLDFLAEQLTHFNLNRLKRRGGQPLITQTIIHELKIPLPPLPEQRAIAEIVQAFDKKIIVLEQEVERLDELFDAMLDELMTGQRSAVSLIDLELLN